jgi:hypothetical protein
VNKKEQERLKREIAEQEAKARSESEDRQEKIKVLSKECKELPNRRDLNELLDELETLSNKYGSSLSDRLRSLHQLAELQDREIEYLTQFRRELQRIHTHYPEQLENLRSATTYAELMQIKLPEPTPKRKYELKRGGHHWAGAGVGLIEYEFGGAREAELRKSTLTGLLAPTDDDPIWQRMVAPTCLDDIFAGGTVHMDNSEKEVGFLPQHWYWIPQPGLQLLFGMDRNRFPNNLRSFKNPRNRRETLYDWRAVVKIMDALLSEKPREREKPSRGLPLKLWLTNPDDPDLCEHVLSGIEVRIKSLSVPEQIKPHIKAEFLEVVHRHLSDSAKK